MQLCTIQSLTSHSVASVPGRSHCQYLIASGMKYRISYRKQSNIGSGNGLGMRLVLCTHIKSPRIHYHASSCNIASFPGEIKSGRRPGNEASCNTCCSITAQPSHLSLQQLVYIAKALIGTCTLKTKLVNWVYRLINNDHICTCSSGNWGASLHARARHGAVGLLSSECD